MGDVGTVGQVADDGGVLVRPAGDACLRSAGRVDDPAAALHGALREVLGR